MSVEVADSSIALPFNQHKQRAVLGHLLGNERFFKQAYHQIKPDWFSQEMLTRRIFEIMLRLSREGTHHPTRYEIEAADELMVETAAEQKKIEKHISLCTDASSQYLLDAMREELTVWLRSVVFAKSITLAGKAYNQSRFDEVQALFEDTSRKVRDVDFNSIGEYHFKDPIDFFQEVAEVSKGALSTGLKPLDYALVGTPDCGGFLPGDTTLMMAPVNIGKSSSMITITGHNLRRGKNVLLMTHEGRPDDIAKKIYTSMIGIPASHMLEYLHKVPGAHDHALDITKRMDRNLTYIPYNKAGMAVEDVIPVIRRAQEDLAAKNGKGYDLLVVDYPAKLTTTRAAKGNLPRREIDRIVYDYYVQLALEYNFHALLAIQTNREGSKVNNGKEDRLLTMEDVSESWGVMEMATNVITLNRSPEAKQRERLTYYIAKSRSNETGIAVVCKSDYATATTHSDELGATWYSDQRTMEDRIDNLLEQYKNQPIPYDQLIF